MNVDFPSLFQEGGINNIVQMFRDLDDKGDSSDDEMLVQTQYKNDKAGEDPLFKAVITNRRGQAATNTSKMTSASTISRPAPSYDDPEAAAREKQANRQRRHLERQVLAARAQQQAHASSARLTEAERRAQSMVALGGDAKCMWKLDEVETEVDERPEPSYEMILRQRVSAQDVYLNLHMRTPGSEDCDGVAVRVTLPGASLASIDLDVKEQLLLVSTPQHLLSLALPQPVLPDSCKAKWDKTKEILTVELDYDLHKI